LASFSCWEPINGKIVEPSCRCHLGSMPDPELVPAVVEYIQTRDPRLIFVQLDHIDAAGHRHGYGSAAYLEQIAQHDLYVGAIVEAIRDAGFYEESLILLVSDHGGHERKHGTLDPQDMTIVWGCRGPGIAGGKALDGAVNIVDTAAVVARALGLSRPPAWKAKVPTGVWADQC
jgi:phosphopentomutase